MLELSKLNEAPLSLSLPLLEMGKRNGVEYIVKDDQLFIKKGDNQK